MARQAWNRKGEQDRDVLEHARALLFALAMLIERAAALPVAERLWFLAVMASGEAEARRLILAMAADPCPGSPAEAIAAPPIAAGDAAPLAARFRMLALAVDAMLAQLAPSPACRHTAPSLRPGRNPHRTSMQITPSPALRATSPRAREREPPTGRFREESHIDPRPDASLPRVRVARGVGDGAGRDGG